MNIAWKEKKLEINDIPEEALGTLSAIYAHILFAKTPTPLLVSSRKQAKIRRWVEKQYSDWIANQVGGIAVYFDNEESDSDVLTFLEKCHAQYDSLFLNRQLEIDKTLKDLPLDVADALKEIVESSFAIIKIRDHTASIELDDNHAFRRTLILSGVSDLPKHLPSSESGIDEDGTESYELEVLKIGTSTNGYHLLGDLQFYDDLDTTNPRVVLHFKEARIETEYYRATTMPFFDNPWSYLGHLALRICQKSTHANNPCNQLELELLPLLKEIANITESWGMPSQYRSNRFPLLAELAGEKGCTKLLPLLEKLGQYEPESAKYDQYRENLTKTLCHYTYEPLWQDIWARLCESQEEYIDRTTLLCPADILEKTKTLVEKQLLLQGYEGSYPDFVQKGPLRGIRLEESYDMSYWVGMEKDVTYYIHCREEVDESGYLVVHFLCGTALNKKNVPCQNIYSCLFNAEGKRLFHTMHYDRKLPGHKGEPDFMTEIYGPNARPDNLALCVHIATKKNHLIKLTREERNIYHAVDGGSLLTLFFIIFAVGGILFGGGMTLFFMLFELITALLCGELAEFPELFMNSPWLMIFLFSGISYGGIMGLITILARRK